MKKVAILLLLIISTSVQASTIALWTKTFGGSWDDEGYSVQQTSDGGYIITGRTESFGGSYDDVWLVKADSLGNEEWDQTFGGTGSDRGYSVQQTSDGGYIIAGRTETWTNGNYDVVLIKTNSLGHDTWFKNFGGSNYDAGYSVQQTSDDGYIVVGTTSSFGHSDGDVYLVKTDSEGNQEWYKTFGGSEGETGWDVQQTTDSGYIITGVTSSYGSGYDDVWLVKIDSVGNEEWDQTFGGSNGGDIGYSVQQTTDSGFVIAGIYRSDVNDAWLIKTDPAGNEEWNQRPLVEVLMIMVIRFNRHQMADISLLD